MRPFANVAPYRPRWVSNLLSILIAIPYVYGWIKWQTLKMQSFLEFRVYETVLQIELVICCSKLLFGFGSVNFRMCEYKYYEKIVTVLISPDSEGFDGQDMQGFVWLLNYSWNHRLMEWNTWPWRWDHFKLYLSVGAKPLSEPMLEYCFFDT